MDCELTDLNASTTKYMDKLGELYGKHFHDMITSHPECSESKLLEAVETSMLQGKIKTRLNAYVSSFIHLLWPPCIKKSVQQAKRSSPN